MILSEMWFIKTHLGRPDIRTDLVYSIHNMTLCLTQSGCTPLSGGQDTLREEGMPQHKVNAPN